MASLKVTTRPETVRDFARSIRRIVLRQSKRANVGHIGSCLSVADLLAAIYCGILRLPEASHPDRDRFILSKGHAGLALYAALALKGIIPESLLDSFCRDASLLGVHPESVLDGVDFSTGSLGHGLSLGAGAAIGARLQQSRRRVVVLLSDAELNEGSMWEAALFAAHHRLSNLIAIVDANGQQALGYTKDVLRVPSLAALWKAWGWEANDLDGHDPERLTRLVNGIDPEDGRPHVFIARTVFGKGVSFMERKIKWHYWPMSDEDYERAMAEVSG